MIYNLFDSTCSMLILIFPGSGRDESSLDT